MAEISRYGAVHWDPAAAARHDALRRAMTGLRLSEMSQMVAEGRIVEAATGRPYEHEAALMVVPVSPRLREGPELVRYRERVATSPAPDYRIVERP